MSPDDPAFSEFQRSDNDALIKAFLCQYNGLGIALALSATQTSDMGVLHIPAGYQQACTSPQRSHWMAAIQKELGGLVTLHTWDLVPRSELPKGSNVMRCHFIFTVKRNRDGSIEKFKARLVADGNTQRYGVDFDRVFSTVVKPQTIRLALIIAAAEDYNVTSIDIRQAYLQADLDQPLYMICPPGVERHNSSGHPLVCKLRRSLYGLKQAGRAWATLFAAFLIGWGFTRSTIDTCLFVYTVDHLFIWVLVWVDDGIIVDNDKQLRSRFVKDLSARFPTEDKGDLQWILGIAVDRDRASRTLTMSQELYISDLVLKYAPHLKDTTRTFDTPFPEGLHLLPRDCPTPGTPEHEAMSPFRTLYMSIVGAIAWVSNMTNPELCFCTSQLARALSNPSPEHVKAAFRVLCYLRSGKSRKLIFKPNVNMPFEVYVDASWTTDYSCSGAMFFFFGSLFAWFSKTQRSVSLSSAEAEYFAAMIAARNALFYRDLLIELFRPQKGTTTMYSDSKSAIDMSRDPVAFKNTKHIMRAAYFLRDIVAKLQAEFQHVAGKLNVADIMTKAVARSVFHDLLRLLDCMSVATPTPRARICFARTINIAAPHPPPFAPCARVNCPCPASWNGRAGNFCCLTCRNGQACTGPFHETPFTPPPY
jgi:hypothetical protein